MDVRIHAKTVLASEALWECDVVFQSKWHNGILPAHNSWAVWAARGFSSQDLLKTSQNSKQERAFLCRTSQIRRERFPRRQLGTAIRPADVSFRYAAKLHMSALADMREVGQCIPESHLPRVSNK